jgi:hypothetical protein
MRKMLAALALLIASFTGVADAQNQPCGLILCTTPYHYLSLASTNSTLVAGRQTALYNTTVINTTATIYYLKLYDKATAPTCGTDTPVHTFPIPVTTAQPVIITTNTTPIGFNNGLGFCLTGLIADADTTVAAVGVAINFDYR